MTKTNALTQSILRYINLSGWKAWRNGNHAVFSRKRNAFMKNPTTLLGVPDIIGFRKSDAKFIAIEIKIGKDKLSPYQKVFIDQLKVSGGVVIVAKDFDSFQKEFNLQNK